VAYAKHDPIRFHACKPCNSVTEKYSKICSFSLPQTFPPGTLLSNVKGNDRRLGLGAQTVPSPNLKSPSSTFLYSRPSPLRSFVSIRFRFAFHPIIPPLLLSVEFQLTMDKPEGSTGTFESSLSPTDHADVSRRPAKRFQPSPAGPEVSSTALEHEEPGVRVSEEESLIRLVRRLGMCGT